MQTDATLLVVEEGELLWRTQQAAPQVVARQAYTGEAYIVNRQDIESRGHPWLILSAKYGFLHPDTVIETYAESFDDPASRPVTPAVLREQAAAMRLMDYSLVLAYGSWRHIARIKAIFRGTSVTTGWSIEAQRRANPETEAGC